MAAAVRHRNRINQITNNTLMTITMKPIVLAILGAAVILLLFSCNNKPDQNDDITNSVNKAGSVETSVQVEHLDSANDVLITSHKIWIQNQEIKTIRYRDTLPSLGIENTTAENQDGDNKPVKVKKDYEIFITVK
jgi:hypothetical protein